MPLKKSKEKKEKEAKAKEKEKSKEAKKDTKKDAKKVDKSGSKGKGYPPTAQQMAVLQQMEREAIARQRSSHSEPPPDVTLQMQKVRVLPAIPPECTCGRHDQHQHVRSRTGREGTRVPASSAGALQQRQMADGTYATVQQVRRSAGYGTVQRGAGTYASVQEVRSVQGAGTYATVKEALTAGSQPASNTYATVQEVQRQGNAAASSASAPASAPTANPTYATVQEARTSQSDYGTVKAARRSHPDYYSSGAHRTMSGHDPLYSTVQRPLPTPDYATVQEAKAGLMTSSITSHQNENYVTMQQPAPRSGAPLTSSSTVYASAQQVRAAKNAKTQEAARGVGGSNAPTVSGAITATSASQGSSAANGNGRGPPTLQPLSQRRAEEQKPKSGGGSQYEGSDLGVGSDLEDIHLGDDMGDGGFQRGGRLRSSLPVVGSPNKTLEKPLGLVFLIFRNETKRALLPNEVTSIDTVRALFVRSFPEQLSMAYFESPKKKVYVLDQTTNVYYELEDLKDVKDRAVLKIYEAGSLPGGVQSPSRSPKTVRGPDRGYYGPGSPTVTGAGQEGSGPHSPAHHGGTNNRPFADPAKAASLPAAGNFLYEQQMSQYGTAAYQQSATGQPLSPSHQVYKIPSNQSSPSRQHPLPQMGMIPNQRHSVAYLPDGTAGFPPDSRMPQSRSYHDYYEGSSRSGSATPTASDQENIHRMDKMEAQLANLAAWVQTAVVQRDGSRPGSARSDASLTSDTSARSKSENATPVRSPSTPPITGLSDVSSATPTPSTLMTADVHTSIRTLNTRAKELKAELRTLRRLQLANAECMRETLHTTFVTIKEVLSTVPGAQDAPVRTARIKANRHLKAYQDDNRRVDQDLADLEAAVEDLRSDVLNKRCRVQSGEVESMALALSNVSKALADLKGKYPSLSEEMKTVMAGEMEVVVKEEKYLQMLPSKLDTDLVRCKKLTRTLFTLKRAILPQSPQRELIGGQYWLASVQEERSPQPMAVPVVTQPDTADKRAVLQNIQAMVPDHQARLNSLQSAESLREMKKRISTQQETLRFEKSLELAQKQLRETNNMEAVEQRQEKLLNGLIKSELAEGRVEPQIPLTDTTKRLSSNMSAPKPAANGKDAPDGKKEAPIKQATKGAPTTTATTNMSPTSMGQTPPQKPPRTLLHDNQQAPAASNGHSDASQAQGKTTGANGTPVTSSEGSHYAVSSAVTTQPMSTAISPGGSLMSTFSTPTSSRAGDSPPHRTPEVGATGKMPMPAPTCTSTPLNGGNSGVTTKNVTFSPSVTEIIDVSPEKTKKMPPPPPPRRSSRSSLRVQSPQGTPIKRGVSPPAYENIENFPAKGEGEGPGPGAGGAAPPGMVMVNRGDPSGRPARPLNRFQQELAEGIYANLNRPDLQNQHVNAAKVLHDPNVKEESKLRIELSGGNSDNESTTSSTDSQSGTIRRNPKAANTEGVTMREGKKQPPPPPIRRSSHLSKAPAVEPVKEESERPKSVHEIQQQFIQMEQANKLQRLQQQGPAPVPVNGNGTNPAGPGVWHKSNNANGGVHKQKMPLPAVPPTEQQVVPSSTNGEVHSDSDSSLSVQSIVTKFSTTQTLNSQTSKVVIQRQSVKNKCEETEIF